ncbi:DUF1365 domain-containing protein [Jatrophihabitans sp. DSM 45814]
MTVSAAPPVGIALPAEYEVEITHRRRDPITYAFTRRSSIWLIDLDDIPKLPRGLRWLSSFRTEDHPLSHQSRPGPPSLRVHVDAFLASQGVGRPATVLMLANPRVLGYVFNPLSVFYCLDNAGRLGQLVVEVRNTYGGRHCYLLFPDGSGNASTDKVFYVSPFYPVDGEYTMRLPVPTRHLLVNVNLQRAGERPFAAVMTGRRRRGDRQPSPLWASLRTPLATRAVMAGIKRHGIQLYLRGLRPFSRSGPRPTNVPAEMNSSRSTADIGPNMCAQVPNEGCKS